MKHAERVGNLIKQIYGNTDFGLQLSRHQAWLIWDQLVGEQIAARARPLRLRNSILEVQVDHPVWMQQLQMLKPQILKKINERIPQAAITDIYLRQTTRKAYQAPTAKKKAEKPAWLNTQLSSSELQHIERELDKISDPELKEEMRALFIR